MGCGHVGMVDGSEIPWWYFGFPHRCVFRLIIIIINPINDTIVDHLLQFCSHPPYLTYQYLAFRLL